MFGVHMCATLLSDRLGAALVRLGAVTRFAGAERLHTLRGLHTLRRLHTETS